MRKANSSMLDEFATPDEVERRLSLAENLDWRKTGFCQVNGFWKRCKARLFSACHVDQTDNDSSLVKKVPIGTNGRSFESTGRSKTWLWNPTRKAPIFIPENAQLAILNAYTLTGKNEVASLYAPIQPDCRMSRLQAPSNEATKENRPE